MKRISRTECLGAFLPGPVHEENIRGLNGVDFFFIKIKIEKTWVFIFYLFDFSFVINFFLMGIDNPVSFIILLLSFFNFLNLKMVNYM